MELILSIFERLQIDYTFFYQFAIATILLFILKSLFFSKLQFVLETRENKTTKLEGFADEMLSESDELSEQFHKEMDRAYLEAQALIHRAKDEVMTRESEKFKAEEKIINEHTETIRNKYAVEVEQKEKEILSKTEILAGELVKKLIQ